MITKTFTYTRFLFDDSSFEYSKSLGIELDIFNETEIDVNLEQYLKRLLLYKAHIKAEGGRVAVYHTVFYDNQCNTEFSPVVAQLLHKLGATFCVSAQRDYDGETIYQCLDNIRERPALFLGEHSLTALQNFIHGFFRATNGGTKEEPEFHGFHDFVAEYYGKTAVAGWKNNILADHWGNEKEALDRFFVLLDIYRNEPNRPSTRDIVHRVLHLAILQFRGENVDILNAENFEEKKVKAHAQMNYELAHWVHNLPLQLKRTQTIADYDDILQDVFDRCRGNKYLYDWLKNNIDRIDYFEYEFWQGIDDDATVVSTLLPISHAQKGVILGKNEKLILSFFAINMEKAIEIKEYLMGVFQ